MRAIGAFAGIIFAIGVSMAPSASRAEPLTPFVGNASLALSAPLPVLSLASQPIEARYKRYRRVRVVSRKHYRSYPAPYLARRYCGPTYPRRVLSICPYRG